MPRKGRKRKTRRGGKRGARGAWSNQQKTISASGIEQFIALGFNFDAGGLVKGGALTFEPSVLGAPGTLSGVNGFFWPINPTFLGQRLAVIALAGYSQWRLSRIRFVWKPMVDANSGTSVTATGGGNGSLNDCNFVASASATSVTNLMPKLLLAFGWTRDPSTPAGSFRE